MSTEEEVRADIVFRLLHPSCQDMTTLLRDAVTAIESLRQIAYEHREGRLLALEKLANCEFSAATALLEALKNLEVCANTVAYCYTHNPGNFAAALKDLQESAKASRAVLSEATASSAQEEKHHD